jgi:hypothetical protein
VIGLRANTCIDSTVRYAANAPNYARAILTTKGLIASIQDVKG